MSTLQSRAALALACVAPFALLGGCNLTASQAQIQAALNPGTITAGQLTASNVIAAGLDPAQAEAFALKVQKTATTACKFEPTFAGIAALTAAVYPPATPILSVSKIAGLACTAYQQRPATVLTAGSDKPKPASPPKPAPAPGTPVTGYVVVNGQLVAVPGVKK